MPPMAKCDFDHDGDVDQEDYGRFQTCYTGPGIPAERPCVAPRPAGRRPGRRLG